MIAFRVDGIPAPQGSKNQFGAESNPRTRPWRAAVTAEAAIGMGGRAPVDGPVKITATFVFTRPKKHFRTRGGLPELRDDAPYFYSNTPDLDKLCRAIGDSLAGVVIKDDKQIAQWKVAKVYGARAGVDINVDLIPR